MVERSVREAEKGRDLPSLRGTRLGLFTGTGPTKPKNPARDQKLVMVITKWEDYQREILDAPSPTFP